MSPTDLQLLLLVILLVGYSISVNSHSKFGSMVVLSTGLGVLLECSLESESSPFSVSWLSSPFSSSRVTFSSSLSRLLMGTSSRINILVVLVVG